MKKPCPHGFILPKGIRCNHGYLEVLLQVNKRFYCKVFGRHTRESQQIAEIHLAEKRKETLLGKFDLELPLKSKTFVEAIELWVSHLKKETDSNGKLVYSYERVKDTKRLIERELTPFFGKFNFDSITPTDIEQWKKKEFDRGIAGTTVNRYQSVLSSIFTTIHRLVQINKIKGMKIPKENPCKYAEWAPLVKRTRILTPYEAKKLKNAFAQLQDLDGWEICKLALKTVLSLKDLRQLELGQEIDIDRAKTGVPINLPVPVLIKLNWKNWRKRWTKARELAGVKDVQFRDLRKSGINWLKGSYDLKLISEYAGHADIATTERSYTIKQAEYLKPLAEFLTQQVDSL